MQGALRLSIQDLRRWDLVLAEKTNEIEAYIRILQHCIPEPPRLNGLLVPVPVIVSPRSSIDELLAILENRRGALAQEAQASHLKPPKGKRGFAKGLVSVE